MGLGNRVSRSVFMTRALLLPAVSTMPCAAESDPTAACIYMTHHGGAQYALAYSGRRCNREGYLTLPRHRYDAVASWSFNALHAGTISALDRYRILARLATLDERSKHGRSNIHDGFKRWSEYKWADHTTSAYLTAVDALGRAEVITAFMEIPLLRLGLAARRDERIELEERRISSAQKGDLLELLATAEGELAKYDGMRAVRRSIEEAARAVASHAEARRRNLSVFRLD